MNKKFLLEAGEFSIIFSAGGGREKKGNVFIVSGNHLYPLPHECSLRSYVFKEV